MKIASWNVNSLRVRLPHLLEWLAEVSPDIVCLQETKTVDRDFPASELSAAGYTSVFAGEKTYNGVAILSRTDPADVEIGLPGDGPDAPKRLISARVGDVTVINAYVPNGQEVGSEKYAFKLEWLGRLERWLEDAFAPDRPVVLCGDFNVALEDRDVHDPDAVRGTIMFSDEERGAVRRILDRGFVDTLRLHTQERGVFSWWDYRAGGFRRNLGWRIDLVLATRPLAERCTGASIDLAPRRRERPSDHAPVLATFEGL